ncbi:HlyD family efflux transporter periplasmic adaptor subunit [Bordetella hinzii]|nr:HlyD family efflux transporter periplasmic adaptor subunit [Bordetella hinzii]AKQ56819.1 Type I secretion system membrane fusion protein PrsE [Bordetella hinzii]KCB21961.1 HlyD family secretion protein [Bordetella hinzii OH87 BAL007II]KCB33561.1 HlyD family secretion protein [Bordetella hinzii CA90 BAL1384]KCB39471.1 HlyD family secretion protein [Bordetella hinzii 5132]KCB52219.1 HlyD family secretion protein [Bordetella hinzii 1277]
MSGQTGLENSMVQDASVGGGGRALLWTIVAAVAGFVGWAHWAELDKITRASGQVIVSSRNQVIQAPDGGVLEEMLVREGDTVKRGQVLFRFQQTRARAAMQESVAKVAGLKVVVARLQAEVFETPLRFEPDADAYPELRDNQIALMRRRQAALNEEIGALDRARKLAQEELSLNQPLVARGDVSRAEVLKLQRQVVDLAGQISNKRNKFYQDAQADLAKAQEDLEGARQVLAQRQDQLEHTEVYAPMDGVVRNVRLTTALGGVARSGDEILQIVPVDEDLVIEAKVKPRDVAFIKPGLPSNIKLDAYDYAIYGSLQGRVSYISADTLYDESKEGSQQPYYRVQVKTSGRDLTSRNGQPIQTQPGMTATVEIKTGKHTVWDYLTKPITKTLGESLQER